LLASITYLIRNINEHKDPLPRDVVDRTVMYVPPTIRADLTQARYELDSIFYNPRKGLSYK
jgi:hypothetical protein